MIKSFLFSSLLLGTGSCFFQVKAMETAVEKERFRRMVELFQADMLCVEIASREKLTRIRKKKASKTVTQKAEANLKKAYAGLDFANSLYLIPLEIFNLNRDSIEAAILNFQDDKRLPDLIRFCEKLRAVVGASPIIAPRSQFVNSGT